jgi:hypothetical protein
MQMRLYELNFLVPWGSGKVNPYFVTGLGVHTFKPVVPGSPPRRTRASP